MNGFISGNVFDGVASHAINKVAFILTFGQDDGNVGKEMMT